MLLSKKGVILLGKFKNHDNKTCKFLFFNIDHAIWRWNEYIYYNTSTFCVLFMRSELFVFIFVFIFLQHPSGFHGHFRSKSRNDIDYSFRHNAKPPPPQLFYERAQVNLILFITLYSGIIFDYVHFLCKSIWWKVSVSDSN